MKNVQSEDHLIKYQMAQINQWHANQNRDRREIIKDLRDDLREKINSLKLENQ